MLAGASRMPHRSFCAANVIGAAIWAVGITLLGYFLGKQIGAENIDKYLLADRRGDHRAVADPAVPRMRASTARRQADAEAKD